MADQALSALVLAETYKQGISEQANRSARALQFIRFDGPSNAAGPAFVIDGYGATAQGRSEGFEVVSGDFSADTRAAASLSWALYSSECRMTGTALRVAAQSSNPVAGENLQLTNLRNAVMAVTEKIGTDFYNGSSYIKGLSESVNDDNGSYAGVSRLTGLGGFKGNVSDPGVATTLTMDHIKLDLDKCFERSGRTPNVAFVSPAVYRKVTGLFTDIRSHEIPVSGGGGEIILRGGADAVEVDGCVFIKDRLVPAGQIVYLNTAHVWFEVLPMLNASGEWSIVPGGDGTAVLPFGMGVKNLAQAGDLEAFSVMSQLQLVNDRPNAHCIRKNVAV